MKGFGEKHQPRKNSKNKKYYSKEQIIYKALIFHSQGNISEASKHYKYFINHYISRKIQNLELQNI